MSSIKHCMFFIFINCWCCSIDINNNNTSSNSNVSASLALDQVKRKHLIMSYCIHCDDQTAFNNLSSMLKINEINMPLDEEIGCSLLHLATGSGNVVVCRLLVQQYHANVNILDSQGNTPLDLACSKKKYAVELYLRQNGGQRASIISSKLNS